MVYAFLLHSLEDGLQSRRLNDNSSLFAIFYTEEGNNSHKLPRQLAICDEAQRQCLSVIISRQKTKTEPAAALKASQGADGIFRIPAGPLFASVKYVLWRQIGTCLYIIVCDDWDNRALVAHFLQLFPKALNDHFRVSNFAGQPSQLMTKPEEVELLLQQLLPCGQLIFMPAPLVKQLRRDVESVVAAAK